MRYRLDRRVRRPGDGAVLLGGDPTRLFRLGPAGVDLLDRVLRGDQPRPGAEAALIERLSAAGVLVPAPAPADSPFSVDDVTVVIPVRDDAGGLSRLLASLALAGRLHGSTPRVVVVDDGSTDPDRVAAAVDTRAGDTGQFDTGAAEIGRLDVTVLRRRASGGPGVARNDGAVSAKTALLAFLDADCVVPAHWLGPLLGHFADPTVGIVAPRVGASPHVAHTTSPSSPQSGGAHAPAWGPRWVWGHDRVRSPLDLGADPARVRPGGRVGYVPSAAMLVRRDRFEELGGFDPALRTGEDVDLVWRAVERGWSVRYEPAVTVDHEVRGGLGAFVSQRVAYGRSAAALEVRHPGAVAPARLGPWSAALAGLLLAGGPGVPAAGLLAGWSTWQLHRRLEGVAFSDTVRLGLGGHWSALRQLLRMSLREWWPLVVPAAAVSRRARRVLLAALGVSLIEAALDGVAPESLPLVPVDDMAYGAGVWIGCVQQRSLRGLGAIRPRLATNVEAARREHTGRSGPGRR